MQSPPFPIDAVTTAVGEVVEALSCDATGGPDANGAAAGSSVHGVAEGEHLSAIAEAHGYANVETLWNAPQNAGLRAVRETPHALLPGDQVVLVAKVPKEFTRPTGQVHTFSVHVEKLVLRLRVLDLLGRPLVNVPGRLTVDGAPRDVTTDTEGVLTTRIARSAQSGRLEIAGYGFEFAIGGLGPACEPYGQSGRLMNLGHWRSTANDPYDDDARELAVELFQQAHGTSPDGAVTTALVSQLSQEHDGEA